MVKDRPFIKAFRVKYWIRSDKFKWSITSISTQFGQMIPGVRPADIQNLCT